MSVNRELLKELFDHGVAAVGGELATSRALESLNVDSVWLLAIGKAASSMTAGALAALGPRLRHGLVITKYDHLTPDLESDGRLTCMEAAHPVPDAQSLRCGQATIEYLQQLPADATLLMLVSGGASALVEALPEDQGLDALQALSNHLLSTGMDIIDMNRIRKSVSLIKGGKLARYHRHARTLQLVISDVPGDRLESIGSGLLVPPAEPGCDKPLPDGFADMQRGAGSAPPADHPVWAQIQTRIIASNSLALEAVAARAADRAIPVRMADGELCGDVESMAETIATTLTAPDAPPGLYLWGGETTVTLPPLPGRGGRNQQLALLLARQIATRADIAVLSCGTDGTDGPGEDAGALVDGNTCPTARRLGLSTDSALARADAGTLLASVGDLVTTGPTGTNVMDLVIALKS